jgi:hypothetical protein
MLKGAHAAALAIGAASPRTHCYGKVLRDGGRQRRPTCFKTIFAR